MNERTENEMPTRPTRQTPETTRETPFDEARAAWRKIDRMQSQIAEVRAGLSPRALALLDTVAGLERPGTEAERRND